MTFAAHRVSRLLLLTFMAAQTLVAQGGEPGGSARDASALIRFEAGIAPKAPTSSGPRGGETNPVFHRGEVVRLVVTAHLRPGAHTYPMTGTTAERKKSALNSIRIRALF